MQKRNMDRAWAEVDLDAIAYNFRSIRAKLKPSTKVMAVVKADAYGHGIFPIVKTYLECGVDAFAVATVDEAIELRKGGIGLPILILGNCADYRAEELVRYDITPSVSSVSFAEALSEAAKKLGKEAKIHIALDTGMSRIGFPITEAARDEILSIRDLPKIFIEGIFTHFAKADEEDPSFTDVQFARFMRMVDWLKEAGLSIPIRHVCNSAGIMEFPQYQLDMVRPGIILYGYYPSDAVDKSGLDIRPAMALKAVVTQIGEKEKETPVSYGGTYVTEKEKTKIATIPIGYADGYLRAFSNRAEVLAGDRRVPILGRVCMDQCMIDVTSVNTIAVGDEVILFGERGDQRISADELAKLAGTISYEILCMVAKRIPRVYKKDGKIVLSEPC